VATLKVKPILNAKITLELSEDEARALDALAGYNIDEFLKFFYEKFGNTYMYKHEDGLRTLFKSARDILPSIFLHIDKARNVFNE
jgi:hypothetical protein